MVEVESGSEQSGFVSGSNLAHVKGTAEPALEDITISSFLARTVSRHGNRDACIFSEFGERWTWDQLAQKVEQLSAGLLALGIYKGDRVGIWAPNRPEWVLTQFATARIGAILVNINPAYRRTELEYALAKSGAKALITAETFKTSNYLEMLQDLAPELTSCRPGQLAAARLPSLKSVIHMGNDEVDGMFRFKDIVMQDNAGQRARLDAIGRMLSAVDAINLQFTSGTTGSPKAATLTHRNVVNNARFVANSMRLNHKDRLCIPVP